MVRESDETKSECALKVSTLWNHSVGRLGCEARHDVADGIQIDGRFHLSK